MLFVCKHEDLFITKKLYYKGNHRGAENAKFLVLIINSLRSLRDKHHFFNNPLLCIFVVIFFYKIIKQNINFATEFKKLFLNH